MSQADHVRPCAICGHDAGDHWLLPEPGCLACEECGVSCAGYMPATPCAICGHEAGDHWEGRFCGSRGCNRCALRMREVGRNSFWCTGYVYASGGVVEAPSPPVATVADPMADSFDPGDPTTWSDAVLRVQVAMDAHDGHDRSWAECGDISCRTIRELIRRLP